MGSFIELNDTLQITDGQGFPANILDLTKHRANPVTLAEVQDKIFSFHNKPGARIYHPAPTRCFFVQNINSQWLYWGKIIILEQTIKGDGQRTATTSGKYKIIEIYDPVYQEELTRHECPTGKSYFG